MLRWIRDRRAWEKAQRLHVFEHATNQPLTLSCDAVGHLITVDDYFSYFNKDQRRKFCMEAGRKW